MSKLSVTEALKLVNFSKTTLYADIAKGVISAEVDAKGRKRIDPAELQRVYGTLKTEQNETPHLDNSEHNKTPEKTDETSEVVSLLKSQVEQLQTEVSVARQREQTLLELLKTEQQKTQQLMLPAPKRKRRSWINPFRLT